MTIDACKTFSFIVGKGGNNHEKAVMVQNKSRAMGSWSDPSLHRADGNQNDGSWDYNQTASADALHCTVGSGRIHHRIDSGHQTQRQSDFDFVVHSGRARDHTMDTRRNCLSALRHHYPKIILSKTSSVGASFLFDLFNVLTGGGYTDSWRRYGIMSPENSGYKKWGALFRESQITVKGGTLKCQIH